MGDKFPRRMADLHGLAANRGRGGAAASPKSEDRADEVSLLEAAVSRLVGGGRTPAASPTNAALPSEIASSSRLSMMLFPRSERLEDTVRSVKKDLGRRM
jgi:hypothetical protein